MKNQTLKTDNDGDIDSLDSLNSTGSHDMVTCAKKTNDRILFSLSFLKSPLSLNTFYNLMGALFPLAAGALTIPFMVKNLGVERFGILTILWSIIGYFSIFDLGIGRAITQQVAAEHALNPQGEKISQMVRTGAEFTFIIGLVAAVGAFFLAHKLAYDWLNVSQAWQEDTELSLKICALGMPLTTVNAGIKGAFEAFEKFFISNAVKIFMGISIFTFPVLAVYFFGVSLLNVTISLVIARALALVLLVLNMHNLPMISIWKTRSDMRLLKQLFSTGIWMAISNIISPALISADRFIISGVVGAASVAYYTVPFEGLTKILIIPGAIGAALFPRISKQFVESKDAAQNTYIKARKINFILMFLGCSLACLLGIPLMRYFLSAEFAEKASIVTLFLAAGVFVNGLAFMPYTALHAKAIVKPVAILHTLEVILYLPVLYCFIRLWGISGAWLAWALRTTIDYIGLIIIKKRFIA